MFVHHLLFSNISSKFSSNSEANASESNSENFEEMLTRYYIHSNEYSMLKVSPHTSLIFVTHNWCDLYFHTSYIH